MSVDGSDDAAWSRHGLHAQDQCLVITSSQVFVPSPGHCLELMVLVKKSPINHVSDVVAII